ncbi:ThuA domain-containing protein [Flavihumibacter stibioxidans]|uniref:Crp/Fnr family transcriptional regulator n=1 Tax=Flavihumibacter stibioxidans TaxID=1834163 RepID=A0ABR7MA43_9BACT|nr:ThuA domain-containing protein [Flavihumibacter stibioxidans]MBC6491842.1 Crp/Fnr family transcriptional regulator [Flavihumibacter stibioxidans]
MIRSLATFLSLSCLALILSMAISCGGRSGKARVLVFSKTAGFYHNSIPDGIAAIQKLGKENGFDVDTTVNAAWFTDDSLKKYSAVIFLSTTGDVLNNYQEAAFERYIQSGGGYVGIHAASDTEYEWGWYGRLAGAYFLDHPGINDTFPNVQPGVLNVVDRSHISTKHLEEKWNKTDEFYSFKKMNPDVKVLVTVDEKSYKGGKNGDHHPMSWYHEYDGGRAFYTNMGHTKETFTEDPFVKHLLGGIRYAIGKNKKLDYNKARTLNVPDEDRFTKTMLVTGQFFEPTELTVLPNLDILVAQRRGEILLVKNGDSIPKLAKMLNVYWKTNTPGVNAEEGVLGIKADPDFEKNRFVYVFYSPIDTSVNRLSRFRLSNDSLVEEKTILDVYSQREICCHTGGSIAFDKDGNLFLSTGDNSTPFDEPKQTYTNRGFAPLDDRQGHEQYDARRSSGNPNDLRGKILRIKVKEDGSYDIPDGNLYPKRTEGTRPEIYVQGNRNPYRISVDQKNGYLYWGEVGPDAGGDSLGVRGPRGYDEVNQARKAGFFGWPLFIANNIPYHEYDYATGKTGPLFDPAKPVNTSRNNTGIKELPPAQPAFIWYPYGASVDFPSVGTGGRNAMAGPVYYTDMFPKETRMPDYMNGKLIIYDWIRGWVKLVTMMPNGDFDKMEPFMPNTKFNNMIDMEVGPDGKLYLLEYGSGWFSKNPDAGLARIDFNGGNRAPKVAGISVDRRSGALPYKVVATVDAKDPEKDPLTYTWNLGNGEQKETTVPQLEYTYSKTGDYSISVTVSDDKKETAKSEPVNVYAGNDEPEVSIKIRGNQTFYFPGKMVEYEVKVSDKNDPTAATDVSGLVVSADYLESPDKAGANLGHMLMSEATVGKSLVQSLDCKSCHKENEKSIGPAYFEVAKKYRDRPDAVGYLVNKIIKGGGGVWGETAMSAHPDLKENDARQIVAWIQSLAAAQKLQPSLPAVGSVKSTLDKKPTDQGVLVISASYTDKGGNNIKPLTGNNSVVLKGSKLDFGAATNLRDFSLMRVQGMTLMIVPKPTGHFSMEKLDLTGVNGAALVVGWQEAPKIGYVFEFRLDAPDGKKIGEAVLKGGMSSARPAGGFGGTMLNVVLEPVTDGKLHNLYIISRVADPAEAGTVALQAIQLISK